MEKYIIDNKEDAQEFLDWIEEENLHYKDQCDQIYVNDELFVFEGEALDFWQGPKKVAGFDIKVSDSIPEDEIHIVSENAPTTVIKNVGKEPELEKVNPYDNALIYGKNNTEGIVAIEVQDNEVLIFKNDGTVETMPFYYWLLTNRPTKASESLDGTLHYKNIIRIEDEDAFKKARGILYGRKADFYNVYDNVEAAMMMEGLTLFKGLKANEVSVLSFDIEANGLINDETAIPYAGLEAKVFMITITFRNTEGKIQRFMFSVDDYEDNDVDMIADFCKKVQELNPSIIVGHNLFGYDFPYLSYCYGTRNGTTQELELGRDCSEIKYNQKFSKFRKDGSQEYPYRNIKIFGRQIIDTFFLAIKYDFSRKYPSYGLKAIIEDEGLIKKGRVFYDASQIAKNWHIIEEREKIKAYGKDDADDSLALFDLMIPQFFYYTQSIPMAFQTINNTATGRQINSFLVRAYLQEGHSIPKTEDKKSYGGGISFGNPGVWNHVNKVDVASLYPSIMITEEVYDRNKDPKAYFLQMVTHFTKERLENKRIGNETGERYYKDVEQGQKIVINSAYGTLGTPGLNFNSFDWADFVTTKGREILQTGIDWAEGRDFQIVNVDTDSFSYSTGKKLDKETFDEHITEVNTLFKEGIIWEDDGQFKTFLVVKAKNYVLVPYKKKDGIKIKGSGLKATMKETALKEFIGDIINALITNKKAHIFSIYNIYAQEVIFPEIDINRWVSKKTVTDAVLNPSRTTEEKILTAIEGKGLSQGDKVFVYFKEDDSLACLEDYDNDHSVVKLLEKIYKTLKIFENVIDMDCYPNYKNKSNQKLLGL